MTVPDRVPEQWVRTVNRQLAAEQAERDKSIPATMVLSAATTIAAGHPENAAYVLRKAHRDSPALLDSGKTWALRFIGRLIERGDAFHRPLIQVVEMIDVIQAGLGHTLPTNRAAEWLLNDE